MSEARRHETAAVLPPQRTELAAARNTHAPSGAEGERALSPTGGTAGSPLAGCTHCSLLPSPRASPSARFTPRSTCSSEPPPEASRPPVPEFRAVVSDWAARQQLGRRERGTVERVLPLASPVGPGGISRTATWKLDSPSRSPASGGPSTDVDRGTERRTRCAASIVPAATPPSPCRRRV